MEFNKCKRCGSFYMSQGEVCSKCMPKDNLEYSNFKNFMSQNGQIGSVTEISCQTGISLKNVNRFLNQEKNKNDGILNIGNEMNNIF